MSRAARPRYPISWIKRMHGHVNTHGYFTSLGDSHFKRTGGSIPALFFSLSFVIGIDDGLLM